jgi:hypothetical protein
MPVMFEENKHGLACNSFVSRQVPGAGFSFLLHPDWQKEHTKRVRRAFRAGSVEYTEMKDGTTLAIVKILPEDLEGYMANKVKLSEGDILEAEHRVRDNGEEGEAPTTHIYAFDGEPVQASQCVSIEYHTDALGEDRCLSVEGFETVSINASVGEDHQDLTSVIRNVLGLIGGSERDYTVEEVVNSAHQFLTTAQLAPVRPPAEVVDRAILLVSKGLMRELPELKALEGCPEPKKEQAANSATHTAQVVVLARIFGQAVGFCEEEQNILLRAAMVHDLGKPATKDGEEGKETYHLHQQEDCVTELPYTLAGMNDDMAGRAAKIGENHDRLLALVRAENPYDYFSLRRVVTEVGGIDNFRLLVCLSQCDDPANAHVYRNQLDRYIEENDRQEREKAMKKEVSRIAQEELNISGPRIGELQRTIVDVLVNDKATPLNVDWNAPLSELVASVNASL